MYCPLPLRRLVLLACAPLLILQGATPPPLAQVIACEDSKVKEALQGLVVGTTYAQTNLRRIVDEYEAPNNVLTGVLGKEDGVWSILLKQKNISEQKELAPPVFCQVGELFAPLTPVPYITDIVLTDGFEARIFVSMIRPQDELRQALGCKEDDASIAPYGELFAQWFTLRDNELSGKIKVWQDAWGALPQHEELEEDLKAYAFLAYRASQEEIDISTFKAKYIAAGLRDITIEQWITLRIDDKDTESITTNNSRLQELVDHLKQAVNEDAAFQACLRGCSEEATREGAIRDYVTKRLALLSLNTTQQNQLVGDLCSQWIPSAISSTQDDCSALMLKIIAKELALKVRKLIATHYDLLAQTVPVLWQETLPSALRVVEAQTEISYQDVTNLMATYPDKETASAAWEAIMKIAPDLARDALEGGTSIKGYPALTFYKVWEEAQLGGDAMAGWCSDRRCNSPALATSCRHIDLLCRYWEGITLKDDSRKPALATHLAWHNPVLAQNLTSLLGEAEEEVHFPSQAWWEAQAWELSKPFHSGAWWQAQVGRCEATARESNLERLTAWLADVRTTKALHHGKPLSRKEEEAMIARLPMPPVMHEGEWSFKASLVVGILAIAGCYRGYHAWQAYQERNQEAHVAEEEEDPYFADFDEEDEDAAISPKA